MANSIRTEKSTRSLMQVQNLEYSDEEIEFNEETTEFSQIIISAVGKYGCPVSVAVDNVLDVYKALKPIKSKIRPKKLPMVKTVSSSEHHIAEAPKKSMPMIYSTLVITAGHDIHNHLVEVSMNKFRFCTIPRIIMHCLKYILPKYTKLTKFKINDCAIDKFTIYELNCMLTNTTITDISLDSTFLCEGNYHILLEQSTTLRHLSLSRCKINDEVCKLIFTELDSGKPAEKMLQTLNVSSNRITDVGAKFIGEVLRRNRHLRYLNLAGNQITDDGATHILNALKEFPLIHEELIDKRSQYIKYLQIKNVIYAQCLRHLESKDKARRDSLNKKAKTKKKTSAISQRSGEKPSRSFTIFPQPEKHNAKVEMMTLELMGPFEHPFDKKQITIKDGYPYCHGNLMLTYLNLAYNDLMYPSLRKLLDVLQNQQQFIRSPSCGLMKVVLEGNNLPQQCIEMLTISKILSDRIVRQCVIHRPPRSSFSGKSAEKKSSAKSTSAK